jgi:RNA polymerase sigma factor (sigma-70 family)
MAGEANINRHGAEFDDIDELAEQGYPDESTELDDEFGDTDDNDPVVAAFYDDIVEASSEADDRSVEDFDLASVIRAWPPTAINECRAAIAAERAPFMAAWRREKRKGAAMSAFYTVVNGILFRDLKKLKETIAAAETQAQTSPYELSRLRNEFNYSQELIFTVNKGLAHNYVSKFTSNSSADSTREFQAAAHVGLMTAINSFDPDLGKFGSWSHKPIVRAVLKAVQAVDHPNMTGGDFERRGIVLKSKEELSLPDGSHTPTDEEIAEHSGVNIALVRRVLAPPKIKSLQTKIGTDENTELGDLIPDDDRSVEDQVIAYREVEALLDYGMQGLDWREKYVISHRFGLGGFDREALNTIGKRLNLSREAVRQIESKAFAKLRHPVILGALVRDGRE